MANEDDSPSSAQQSQDDNSERYMVGFIIANIVGLKYYSGRINGRELVGLVREPSNLYDENAIRVLNRRSLQVGHIERAVAAVLSPLIDSGKILVEGIVPNTRSTANRFKIPCQVHVFAKLEETADVKSAISRAGLVLVSDSDTAFGLSEAVVVKERMGGGGEKKSVDKIFKLVDENVKQKEKMVENRQLYDHMEGEAKGVVQNLINSGSLMRNYSTVLSIILRLRQLCDDISLCPPELRSLTTLTSIEDVTDKPELLQKLVAILQDGEDFDCPICISPPRDIIITRCAHIFCRQENPNTKSVVFSQFKKMLLLLETPLKAAGFTVLRLDGAMTVKKRTQVIGDFGKPELTGPVVLLASLKASGAGINLTAASRVYLFEPWWNPAVEEQAMDRIHRIGQKQEVKMIRMIARNSIEERVLELQQKKKNLANEAFKSKAWEGSKRG
ncbi:hypothetical protein F2Q69_00045592 [Brassica cretica]|uniref:Helicase C-terminal domain-containing protein n=1 Tax=Brassica cretica TaxID=69181 RepID=A0A8S9NA30_BRACR|nr:hypothetical protein F2Q69_00045592 [Brassica cretica]